MFDSKYTNSAPIYDSMNPTRIPKEFLLPDCARRVMSDTKGDRVQLPSVSVHRNKCFNA